MVFAMQQSQARKALIIEDDPLFRELLAKLLREKLGCMVIEMDDGLDALKFLRLNHKNIDFVVCDIVIPSLNGMNLVEFCKKHNEYSGLKFVMVTNDASSELKTRAATAGVEGYIFKNDARLHDFEQIIARCV